MDEVTRIYRPGKREHIKDLKENKAFLCFLFVVSLFNSFIESINKSGKSLETHRSCDNKILVTNKSITDFF